MGEKTTIEWTHHTFNPWWGCAKVSPGCDHCYAESWARRFAVRWGSGETRKPASERTWAEPIKWNRQAEKDGVRRRVFCASMADVFDNEGLEAEREWLWELIEETPALDWLLLTKRVGNVMNMIPARWQTGLPPNVWIGATIVNQAEADRDIPKLKQIPARIRFLSLEPLLGPIELPNMLAGFPQHITRDNRAVGAPLLIDWVIVGGESGRQARPMNPDWARLVRDQCVAAGVSYFFKQWGEWFPVLSIQPGGGTALPPDRSTYPEVVVGNFVMQNLGKRLSGRELDGRIWNEFPKIAT